MTQIMPLYTHSYVCMYVCMCACPSPPLPSKRTMPMLWQWIFSSSSLCLVPRRIQSISCNVRLLSGSSNSPESKRAKNFKNRQKEPKSVKKLRKGQKNDKKCQTVPKSAKNTFFPKRINRKCQIWLKVTSTTKVWNCAKSERKKNIARIAKRCPENITLVVKVSKCSY